MRQVGKRSQHMEVLMSLSVRPRPIEDIMEELEAVGKPLSQATFNAVIGNIRNKMNIRLHRNRQGIWIDKLCWDRVEELVLDYCDTLEKSELTAG